MKLNVFAVGKPAFRYARDGVAEYAGRIRHPVKLAVRYFKDGAEVEQKLLAASSGGIRVVLDERGERLTTADLVRRVERWQLGGVKEVAFLIGGADGHSESLRAQCDLLLSLSSLTLQHELALVVLLEQLYRVQTVLRGEPYHR